MPRNIAILPALALMTSGAIAQTPQTADAKLREMLSRRGMDRAQETAIDQLFSIAPDGRLTRETAETVDLRAHASERVRQTRPACRHVRDIRPRAHEDSFRSRR